MQMYKLFPKTSLIFLFRLDFIIFWVCGECVFGSFFLTNATLKIENSALRLMPFHAFSPALRRHFFRVNKTKRCPKAAEMRFFQHDFINSIAPIGTIVPIFLIDALVISIKCLCRFI